MGKNEPFLIVFPLLLNLGTTCLAKTTFVFGDSLVDSGNNNYIVSLSKANYAPNGIDFGGPTGRYTNGKTIADFIVEQLGFRGFTPPYLAPTTAGDVLLQGVNYASGGGGILNATGYVFGGRINLDAQIDNFANTKREIESLIGKTATSNLLKNALVSITIGSNDFINNYLTPVLSIPKQLLISPESFVGAMISKYTLQLKRVFNMGARKIVVVNVGPIGCIPFERDTNPLAGDGCVAFSNRIAEQFNQHLRGVVKSLNANLGGAQFVYADVYRIVDDIIRHFPSYGFENGNSSCCALAGRFGGLIPCGPPSKVCKDRSKYVFWDPFHPTEAANSIIANRLLNGGSDDVWPVNVRTLLASFN